MKPETTQHILHMVLQRTMPILVCLIVAGCTSLHDKHDFVLVGESAGLKPREIHVLEKAANAGDVSAALRLAAHYDYLRSLNEAFATQWLRKAGELGDRNAAKACEAIDLANRAAALKDRSKAVPDPFGASRGQP